MSIDTKCGNIEEVDVQIGKNLDCNMFGLENYKVSDLLDYGIEIKEKIIFNGKTFYRLSYKNKELFCNEENIYNIDTNDFIFDTVELPQVNETYSINGKLFYKGIMNDTKELDTTGENKFLHGKKGMLYFIIGEKIEGLNGFNNCLVEKIGAIHIIDGRIFYYAELDGKKSIVKYENQ